eukprot:TRINITY_DN5765_c0_g3_i1.p1 TRINITY_DN5765_c0_g3~~TRINITY_DN5765_c0_g3_i1.p1  ORF type:complete len:352 (+),score=29.57 TRINITY_DN5765_c0_g3_i1:68-1123(+)
MVRLFLRSLAWTGFVGCSSATKDTLLDEQLCQHYYRGTGDCAVLRAAIQSKVRGTGVPTLELGDSSKPAMVFLHGWPDTAALWANQFEKFCLGESATFFCVAPSWIDFHPDYPRAKLQELLWDVQRDRFHSVIEDLRLTDVTFVIFDFGALVGYQYAWQHPGVVRQVIAMQIGMETTPPERPLPHEGSLRELPMYQQNAIRAFKADNDTAMAVNLMIELGATSPCDSCRIAPGATGVGARTGWPYYELVRHDENGDWIDRLAPGVPPSNWKFSLAPSFPEHVPFLFLWSEEPCSSPSFRDWVDSRGDGSKAVRLMGTDHWLQARAPKVTNEAMERWLLREHRAPPERILFA